MVVTVSSLSVGLQSMADFLVSAFGQDVQVSLDSPQHAEEQAKKATRPVLNLFVYRLAPGGFQSDPGSGDPLFVRAHVLMTCFPHPADANTPPDTDLRVLGAAMAILHSKPTLPMPDLTPPNGAAADDFRLNNPTPYQLQAVLQAPTMEEMNHIWTTQGAELAYRLSAAYELALIPIEPLERRIPAAPFRTAILDIGPSSDLPAMAGGVLALGAEPQALAMAAAPVAWAPMQMFALAGGGLANARAVAAGTAAVDLAVSGPFGQRVRLSVVWTRAGGAVVAQAAQVAVVQAQRLDQAQAVMALNLTDAVSGDRAVITATAAAADGSALPGAAPGNVLTLTVGA